MNPKKSFWFGKGLGVKESTSESNESYVIQEPSLIYIRVWIPEVRNLRTGMMYSNCTPYLKLIYNGVSHRSEYGAGLHPKFEDHFTFAVDSKLIHSEESQMLVIKVRDYVKYLKKDELGEIMLPLDDIVGGLFREGKWFPISRSGAVEFVRDVVSSVRERLGTVCEASEPRMLVYADVESYRPPQRQTIGQVTIAVQEVSKLRLKQGKEKYRFSLYAIVQYESSWGILPTKVGTNNPTWDQTFTFPVTELSSVVSIAIFDNRKQRMKKDKLIGLLRIRISTLIGNTVHRTDAYPLYVVHRKVVRVMGQMKLSIGVEYFVPLMGVLRHFLSPSNDFYCSHLSARQLAATKKARALQIQQFLFNRTPSIPMEVSEVFIERDDLPRVFIRKFGQSRLRLAAAIKPFLEASAVIKSISFWELPAPAIAFQVVWPLLMYNSDYIIPLIVFLATGKLALGLQTRVASSFPLHPDVALTNLELSDVMTTRGTGGEENEADSDDEEVSAASEGSTEPQLSAFKKIEIKLEEMKQSAALAQQVIHDLASQVERLHALFSWEDPIISGLMMSAGVVVFCAFWYFGSRFLFSLMGLFLFRHPMFRDPYPPGVLNLFRRLPQRVDRNIAYI